MRHKVAGILLLLCLIVPIVAAFMYLHYQKALVRREVKHQMIAGIDKDELVLLKFTEKESQTKLRWEHSKEFEYQGQMYDILEKEIKGETTYYWCWWDHKETKLNRRLDGLVDKVLESNPQNRDKQEELAEFYKKLYFNKYPELLVLSKQIETGYYTFSESCLSIYYSPLVPPPRFS